MLLFGIQYSDLDFEGEIIFFFFSFLGCDNLQKCNDITFTMQSVQTACTPSHVFVVPHKVLMSPEKHHEGHGDVTERVHQVLIK